VGKKKSAYRGGVAYAASSREPVGRSRREQPDSSRRKVTFAVVVVGMLIAAWVLVASLGLGEEAAGQQAGTGWGTQQGMDDRSLQAAAAPLLQRAQESPENEGVMIALGNLYYDAARWESAVEWYTKALERVPANTDVRTDLGTAYFYSGDSVRAKEQWFKALEQEPDKIQTHYNLGILYSHENPSNVEEARKSWEKVIQIAPNSEQGKAAQRNLDRMKSQ
jgi:cytochrome c-type biogenesis protein CcmH/NrfG